MTLELVPDAPVAPVIHLDFDRQSEIKHEKFCRHRKYLVHADTRTVSCATCGAPLEAFKVLLDYAQRERSWRHYDSEIRRATERLAELRAEERKVKARTKNATRKEADAAVEAERVRTERERMVAAELARDAGALCRRIDGLMRRGK